MFVVKSGHPKAVHVTECVTEFCRKAALMCKGLRFHAIYWRAAFPWKLLGKQFSAAFSCLCTMSTGAALNPRKHAQN